MNVCVKCVEGDCKAVLQAGGMLLATGGIQEQCPPNFLPTIFLPLLNMYLPPNFKPGYRHGRQKNFLKGGGNSERF